MLTFNSTVSKGASSEVTLDKTALAELASESEYYSQESNWEKVVVVYKSSTRNQKEILSFDASEALPTTSFLISDKSDGDFLLDKVIIRDCDGGSFAIGRSSLESLGLDVVIASGELSVKTDIIANFTDGYTDPVSGTVYSAFPSGTIFPYLIESMETNKFYAQSFVAEGSFDLKKISILLGQTPFATTNSDGTPYEAKGTLSFGIWEMSGGKPVANNGSGVNDMAYGLNTDIPTVNVSDIAASGFNRSSELPGHRYTTNGDPTWDSVWTQDVEFANPISLVDGTSYALIIKTDSDFIGEASFEKFDHRGNTYSLGDGTNNTDQYFSLHENGNFFKQNVDWGSSWTTRVNEDIVFRIFGS